MVGDIASVTQEEDFFPVRVSADNARRGFFFLVFVIFNPGIYVKFGDLFLVFDVVGGDDGAWGEKVSRWAS